jgi:enamine deaminase RidA (YjgF/YER057c/UK114 family)
MTPVLESLTPDGWPRGAGYSHGIAGRGRLVWVAGQVGWDPLSQQIVSDDFAAQVDQALGNVIAILAAAGAAPSDTARMTWFITDRSAYLQSLKEIGAAWRRHFHNHYPAMSVVVVPALLETGALVEIEATALIAD